MPLSFGFANMLLLNQILFSHTFDGIELAVGFVLTEHHFPEGPSAQNLQ